MTNLNDMTGFFKDMMGAFPVDTKSFEEAMNELVNSKNIFFDPELVTRLLKMHDKMDLDIVTTMFPRTYPPGLTTEIISTSALEFAISKIKKPFSV